MPIADTICKTINPVLSIGNLLIVTATCHVQPIEMKDIYTYWMILVVPLTPIIQKLSFRCLRSANSTTASGKERIPTSQRLFPNPSPLD